MGLWCGHAVLPFPSLDLVFLFHLLDQVALALVAFFGLVKKVLYEKVVVPTVLYGSESWGMKVT